MPHYRRFSDISVSEKILDSLLLITLGIGYLFATVHLYYTHQGRDGVPGLSIEDIRIAYYGEHQQTRLGAALNGAMGGNLSGPDQKQIIIDWIEEGSKETGYIGQVAPILNEHCIMCHSKSSGMGLPSLETYQNVIKLTETDTGASIQSLVRVSHIHFFGIAFLLYLIGRIFILCEMPVMMKRVTVAIPFIAMLIDILSWYATKVFPGFAYAVVLAGAMIGLSIAVQILASLYQMWFYKQKVVPVEM